MMSWHDLDDAQREEFWMDLLGYVGGALLGLAIAVGGRALWLWLAL